MKLTIVDNHEAFLREITGKYAEGNFTYKDGGFLGFGGIEKNMAIPYACLLATKKGKEAWVKYDGKNYSPIAHEKAEHLSTIQDYITQQKVNRLTAQSQIKKPIGFGELLQIIVIIMLIVAVVGLYLVTSAQKDLAHNLMQPLNTSIQQNQVLIHVLLNQTKTLFNLTKGC